MIGAAIASGAASLIGQVGQNRANRKLQAEQQNWNLDQWNRQNSRDDQIWDKQNAYNYEMWNEQNQYNSPQSQMARFKDAGLNPHLIYGKGNPGNAQAMQSNNQRNQAVQGYSRAEANSVTKGMDVFGQYQSFKATAAQTDNVKAQTDIAREEVKLKAQEQLLRALNLKRGEFAHGVDKQLRDTSIQAAVSNLNLTNKKLEQQSLVKEGLGLQNQLTQKEINQATWGLGKSDPVWMRMGAQAIDKFKPQDYIMDWWKNNSKKK